MRIPVNQPFSITTPFGVPDSNAKFGYHSGIDYGVPSGRTVYAPASGTLTNVVSPTGGNMVVIFDGTYYHRLMHNSSFSRGNGHVDEGNEVAKSGTTGLSTGPHSHWDINTQGTYPTSFSAFVDPNNLINQGGIMPADKVYEELNKRDKRLDKIEADIASLYKIVDDNFKAINAKLTNIQSGSLDGDYHITKKG